MVMKKTMKTEAPIVIGNSSKEKELFLPGFVYRTGSIIHTVVEDVTQERNSEMRRALLSDGSTEIISVDSIKKDLREHDADILPVDEKYVEKKREVKEAVKGGKISKSKIKKAVKKVGKKKSEQRKNY